MVGLVLYISSINDEMLNRTKDAETYFNYKYGWSFAFAAISFLLTEVKPVTLSRDRLGLGVAPLSQGKQGKGDIPQAFWTLDHPPYFPSSSQNVSYLPGSPPTRMSPRALLLSPRSLPTLLELCPVQTPARGDEAGPSSELSSAVFSL